MTNDPKKRMDYYQQLRKQYGQRKANKMYAHWLFKLLKSKRLLMIDDIQAWEKVILRHYKPFMF